MYSAHVDTFAHDHLPPVEQQPVYLFDAPQLQFPMQLNCASELLDRHIQQGHGSRNCIVAPGVCWSYADLQAHANRIAHVLVQEMGVIPGNRVLLHAFNAPMLAACWFAVIKVGAIAVTSMPLLRAPEIAHMVHTCQIRHALCGANLWDVLQEVTRLQPALVHIRCFSPAGVPLQPHSSAADLAQSMARYPAQFENVPTAATDTCLIAFSSGTSGTPKATMHFHRDVMAACACWPAHVLRPSADDVFIGSPPLAFTFGLGCLLLFPLAVGASVVLLERIDPDQLPEHIGTFQATVLVTVPTAYRALIPHGQALRRSTLRRCVSAGEVLPVSTRTAWKDATGLDLIDGIGATEMLHIFISSHEADVRPGATGKVVPGYVAQVVDAQGQPLPPGACGWLAVRGPTGCRYLADTRQTDYVQDGWNVTGDAYIMDADGYFFFQGRTDDMIISSGYNIAAPEVEDALLQHPAVAECAVVGHPDSHRGQIVQAFVVLKKPQDASPSLVQELQDFVKQTIAPYKYPRALVFVADLPRTPTGKLQRFKLRQQDAVSVVTP